MNKNISIFIGSPIDVQYALSLYEQYKSNYVISFYVINIKSVYEFIKSLNLTLGKIVFIPYNKNLNIKYPNQLIKEKIRLKKIYNNLFGSKSGERIIFFSVYFDWIVFFMISRIAKLNYLEFYNVHKYEFDTGEAKRVTGFKDKIKLVLFSLMIGIQLKQIWFPGNKRVLKFPIEKYKIEIIDNYCIDKNIFNKYSYKMKNINNNSLLFFDKTFVKNGYIKNTQATLRSIFEIFNDFGIYVYVKPHPRLGCSDYLDEYIFDRIPEFVPAEFLDVTQFKAIFSVYTSAVIKHALDDKIPVYSLMNVFEFNSKEEKENLYRSFREKSKDKIRFINSLEELQRELRRLVQ